VSPEDWLKDPLMAIGEGSFAYIETTNIESQVYKSWTSFHFDTRLKLNGADYFLRQLLGSVSRPDRIGSTLLAFHFRQWYLDAFFFELMAAYEILIQELNTIYECGAKAYDRDIFSKVKRFIPEDLANLLEEEQKKEWFRKLRWYRNSITHRSRNITDDFTLSLGDTPWHYTSYEIHLTYYNERTSEWEREQIGVCETYFNNMTDHIHAVWKKIKEQCF
jgi:hypothetical protein